jgi:hypothetical protein
MLMRAEDEKTQSQQREQISRNQSLASAMLADAEKAIRVGDLTSAADLARIAASADPNNSQAQGLNRKVEKATTAAGVFSILCGLPDSEFKALREAKAIPAALNFGFDSLNTRAIELARNQVERASETREKNKAESEAHMSELRRRADAARTAPPSYGPASRDSRAKIYKTGDGVHVGYSTYAVWSAWWSDRLSNNDLLNQRPNAKFLFIDISVRNDDKQARMVPPFKLTDERGAEYDSDPSAWSVEGSMGVLTDLNPGVAKRGLVVFDVPQGRTYTLKVDGGFWSSESAYIGISPGETK